MNKQVKSETVNIRIDPETLQRLKEIAKRDDRSVSWQVVKFIQDGLSNVSQANN